MQYTAECIIGGCLKCEINLHAIFQWLDNTYWPKDTCQLQETTHWLAHNSWVSYKSLVVSVNHWLIYFWLGFQKTYRPWMLPRDYACCISDLIQNLSHWIFPSLRKHQSSLRTLGNFIDTEYQNKILAA